MATVPKFGLDPARAPAPVRESQEPIIRLFGWHDAHPITLFFVLLKRFGTDFLTWDPAALRAEIVESFQATGIAATNWQKIEAVRTVLLVTSPWTEWEVFEKVIQALNNNQVDPGIVQKCSLSRLMAGVDMMNQLDSNPSIPDNLNPDTPPWSDEVQAYVAACAVEEGVMYLPPPLDFAQVTLSQPTYKCRDCGNEDTDDLADGLCDVCVGRFRHERPFSGLPDVVPEKEGRNIVRFYLRDPSEVRPMFDAWVAKRPAGFDPDNAVELQAGKLLVAYDYMLLRRRQLQEQLESLRQWVGT